MVKHRTAHDEPLARRVGDVVARVADRTWVSSAAGATVTGLVMVGVYAWLLTEAMARTRYDLWGALIVGPALLLLSWPLLVRAMRTDDDGWVRRLIGIAYGLKLVGGLARWAVAFVLYGGSADAARYDAEGTLVAQQFRDGDFAISLAGRLEGTRFTEVLTGVVYTITGPTLLGGYLVFSWLGFWGLYFFYRAFRVAMPRADHRRYALLVFLLPSLVFWPSGIGKEAWMCLCLGLATFGAARLLTGTRGSTMPLALGLAGSAMVRPHMTAIVFVGIVAAFLFRRDVRRTLLTPLARTLTLSVLAVAGVVIAGRAGDFFALESVTAESVGTVLDTTGTRTDEGGSEFTPQRVRSPVDFPAAFVTVLFRPFPWEASNLQALATSLETAALLVFAMLSWKRLRNVWVFKSGRPYIVLCLVYTTLFVIGFSTFGNFGLLARQRSLVYPFLLVLLCLPTLDEMRRRRMSPVHSSIREPLHR